MGAAEEDAAALELLERARWGGAAPRCPHCGAGECAFLRPVDGLTRATRTGARTARRVWRCRACRRQFSVLTGTVLAGSRVPPRTLVGVLTEWTAGSAPPLPPDVAARHGLTAEAARHPIRRVGAAISASGAASGAADPLAALFAIDGTAIRRRTPARPRPRRQVGPSADHGAG